MTFVAFSDIHYADYGTGVTVSDIAKVERSITDHCKELGTNVCIFCGDRYLSHEPQDYIRVISDTEQRYRNDAGIVTFSLVGNHDLYAKAPVSGHSNRHLQTVWGEYMPNIVVMDELKTYRHPSVPKFAVHAIPACFQWDSDLLSHFDFQPEDFNLLVFHDLLEGCVLDHRSDYKSPKGNKLTLIDDARFDLVLGGDVHLPQRLPFQHTRGGYVGACIQQSRRDRGNSRGWLAVHDLEHMEFIESCAPRFVDFQWDLSCGLPSPQNVCELISSEYEDTPEANIVDVVLTGTREQLEAVPLDWHTGLQRQLGARRVNVPIKKPTLDLRVISKPDATAQRSPVEDFHAFLASGRAALDGNDPGRLMAKATPILAALGRHRNG